MNRTPAVEWLERRQIALYVLAIVAGTLAGWWIPGTSALEAAINPVLGLLLFATFLAV
ncbi:hypothetical protein ACFWQJ_12665 [Kocuria palustris]|uniref:hypothetical protein n=1 Tax=Kocuria palustris TaxID=71999 RepID=UPI0036602529